MATKDKTIKLKQVRSLIGCTNKQICSMKGLGLRKINHQVTVKDTSEARGMIKVVRHMVEVTTE
ncbi:MAG: 50S ribosomal protein L30 [Gammaproteobacteria bacterium]|nr:50S ribosomal protein L30 [Gammaproteobacteria bacterium]|tara:strand:- start:1326 stop:1517 length:192 start_codon:yes stop_codon:yes gene_type:complete